MSRPSAQVVLEHLRGQEAAMVDLLRRLVDLDSPSDVPDSVAAVREVLADELEAAGCRTRLVRAATGGHHLFARPLRGSDANPVQLVLGHFDTVWPLGEVAERPAAVSGSALSGPGSFDMKGGVVQLVFALGCLRDIGIPTPADVAVFFNSDEEIGSPDSRRWIMWLAELSSRVFVLEGAFGPAGALKVGRKGVGRYVVQADGVAAHSGLDPGSGASAVLEIAHQIQALFAMNDPERGVTVNVGTVDGGLRPNVVAPRATAHVEVRVATLEDADQIDAAMRSLKAQNPDVTLSVTGRFGRPPMEPTPRNLRLWQQAERIAGELGLSLESAEVGGASDGNLTSQRAPTLDGLGAVGHGAHRLDEQVVIPALAERAALLALLLASPIDNQSPGASP